MDTVAMGHDRAACMEYSVWWPPFGEMGLEMERKGSWMWLGRIEEPWLGLVIFASLYSGQGIERAEAIS
jgi:hypothetical protein